jgi:hypothetical protein
MLKHDWFLTKFGFVACRVCGRVQNNTNRDAGCSGPVRVLPRAALAKGGENAEG